MGGGIYELRLALKDPSADAERAERIVNQLGEQRPVASLGGHWWSTEYADFENQDAAAKALHLDLRGIDEEWDTCLVAGWLRHPSDET